MDGDEDGDSVPSNHALDAENDEASISQYSLNTTANTTADHKVPNGRGHVGQSQQIVMNTEESEASEPSNRILDAEHDEASISQYSLNTTSNTTADWKASLDHGPLLNPPTTHDWVALKACQDDSTFLTEQLLEKQSDDDVHQSIFHDGGHPRDVGQHVTDSADSLPHSLGDRVLGDGAFQPDSKHGFGTTSYVDVSQHTVSSQSFLSESSGASLLYQPSSQDTVLPQHSCDSSQHLDSKSSLQNLSQHALTDSSFPEISQLSDFSQDSMLRQYKLASESTLSRHSHSQYTLQEQSTLGSVNNLTQYQLSKTESSLSKTQYTFTQYSLSETDLTTAVDVTNQYPITGTESGSSEAQYTTGQFSDTDSSKTRLPPSQYPLSEADSSKNCLPPSQYPLSDTDSSKPHLPPSQYPLSDTDSSKTRLPPSQYPLSDTDSSKPHLPPSQYPLSDTDSSKPHLPPSQYPLSDTDSSKTHLPPSQYLLSDTDSSKTHLPPSQYPLSDTDLSKTHLPPSQYPLSETDSSRTCLPPSQYLVSDTDSSKTHLPPSQYPLSDTDSSKTHLPPSQYLVSDTDSSKTHLPPSQYPLSDTDSSKTHLPPSQYPLSDTDSSKTHLPPSQYPLSDMDSSKTHLPPSQYPLSDTDSSKPHLPPSQYPLSDTDSSKTRLPPSQYPLSDTDSSKTRLPLSQYPLSDTDSSKTRLSLRQYPLSEADSSNTCLSPGQYPLSGVDLISNSSKPSSQEGSVHEMENRTFMVQSSETMLSQHEFDGSEVSSVPDDNTHRGRAVDSLFSELDKRNTVGHRSLQQPDIDPSSYYEAMSPTGSDAFRESLGLEQSIKFQPSDMRISLGDSIWEKRPVNSSTPSSKAPLTPLEEMSKESPTMDRVDLLYRTPDGVGEDEVTRGYHSLPVGVSSSLVSSIGQSSGQISGVHPLLSSVSSVSNNLPSNNSETTVDSESLTEKALDGRSGGSSSLCTILDGSRQVVDCSSDGSVNKSSVWGSSSEHSDTSDRELARSYIVYPPSLQSTSASSSSSKENSIQDRSATKVVGGNLTLGTSPKLHTPVNQEQVAKDERSESYVDPSEVIRAAGIDSYMSVEERSKLVQSLMQTDTSLSTIDKIEEKDTKKLVLKAAKKDPIIMNQLREAQEADSKKLLKAAEFVISESQNILQDASSYLSSYERTHVVEAVDDESKVMIVDMQTGVGSGDKRDGVDANVEKTLEAKVHIGAKTEADVCTKPGTEMPSKPALVKKDSGVFLVEDNSPLVSEFSSSQSSAGSGSVKTQRVTDKPPKVPRSRTSSTRSSTIDLQRVEEGMEKLLMVTGSENGSEHLPDRVHEEKQASEKVSSVKDTNKRPSSGKLSGSGIGRTSDYNDSASEGSGGGSLLDIHNQSELEKHRLALAGFSISGSIDSAYSTRLSALRSDCLSEPDQSQSVTSSRIRNQLLLSEISSNPDVNGQEGWDNLQDIEPLSGNFYGTVSDLRGTGVNAHHYHPFAQSQKPLVEEDLKSNSSDGASNDQQSVGRLSLAKLDELSPSDMSLPSARDVVPQLEPAYSRTPSTTHHSGMNDTPRSETSLPSARDMAAQLLPAFSGTESLSARSDAELDDTLRSESSLPSAQEVIPQLHKAYASTTETVSVTSDRLDDTIHSQLSNLGSRENLNAGALSYQSAQEFLNNKSPSPMKSSMNQKDRNMTPADLSEQPKERSLSQASQEDLNDWSLTPRVLRECLTNRSSPADGSVEHLNDVSHLFGGIHSQSGVSERNSMENIKGGSGSNSTSRQGLRESPQPSSREALSHELPSSQGPSDHIDSQPGTMIGSGHDLRTPTPVSQRDAERVSLSDSLRQVGSADFSLGPAAGKSSGSQRSLYSSTERIELASQHGLLEAVADQLSAGSKRSTARPASAGPVMRTRSRPGSADVQRAATHSRPGSAGPVMSGSRDHTQLSTNRSSLDGNASMSSRQSRGRLVRTPPHPLTGPLAIGYMQVVERGAGLKSESRESSPERTYLHVSDVLESEDDRSVRPEADGLTSDEIAKKRRDDMLSQSHSSTSSWHDTSGPDERMGVGQESLADRDGLLGHATSQESIDRLVHNELSARVYDDLPGMTDESDDTLGGRIAALLDTDLEVESINTSRPLSRASSSDEKSCQRSQASGGNSRTNSQSSVVRNYAGNGTEYTDIKERDTSSSDLHLQSSESKLLKSDRSSFSDSHMRGVTASHSQTASGTQVGRSSFGSRPSSRSSVKSSSSHRTSEHGGAYIVDMGGSSASLHASTSYNDHPAADLHTSVPKSKSGSRPSSRNSVRSIASHGKSSVDHAHVLDGSYSAEALSFHSSHSEPLSTQHLQPASKSTSRPTSRCSQRSHTSHRSTSREQADQDSVLTGDLSINADLSGLHTSHSEKLTTLGVNQSFSVPRSRPTSGASNRSSTSHRSLPSEHKDHESALILGGSDGESVSGSQLSSVIPSEKFESSHSREGFGDGVPHASIDGQLEPARDESYDASRVYVRTPSPVSSLATEDTLDFQVKHVLRKYGHSLSDTEDDKFDFTDTTETEEETTRKVKRPASASRLESVPSSAIRNDTVRSSRHSPASHQTTLTSPGIVQSEAQTMPIKDTPSYISGSAKESKLGSDNLSTSIGSTPSASLSVGQILSENARDLSGGLLPHNMDWYVDKYSSITSQSQSYEMSAPLSESHLPEIHVSSGRDNRGSGSDVHSEPPADTDRVQLASAMIDELDRMRHNSGRSVDGSRPSSTRSSQGSIVYDNLQRELDEIQRGLIVLQKGDLSFHSIASDVSGVSQTSNALHGDQPSSKAHQDAQFATPKRSMRLGSMPSLRNRHNEGENIENATFSSSDFPMRSSRSTDIQVTSDESSLLPPAGHSSMRSDHRQHTLRRSQDTLLKSQLDRSQSRNTLQKSQTHLSRSRESLQRSQNDLSQSHESQAELSRSRESLRMSKTDLSGSRESLRRSQTDLSRSRESLRRSQTDLSQKRDSLPLVSSSRNYSANADPYARIKQKYAEKREKAEALMSNSARYSRRYSDSSDSSFHSASWSGSEQLPPGSQKQVTLTSTYQHSHEERKPSPFTNKVEELMQRESPSRQAYGYLEEAERSTRDLSLTLQPCAYSPVSGDASFHPSITDISPQRSINASHHQRSLRSRDASPTDESLNMSPIPQGPLSAYSTMSKFISTQVDKRSKEEFDHSIELRTPFKRHLEDNLDSYRKPEGRSRSPEVKPNVNSDSGLDNRYVKEAWVEESSKSAEANTLRERKQVPTTPTHSAIYPHRRGIVATEYAQAQEEEMRQQERAEKERREQDERQKQAHLEEEDRQRQAQKQIEDEIRLVEEEARRREEERVTEERMREEERRKEERLREEETRKEERLREEERRKDERLREERRIAEEADRIVRQREVEKKKKLKLEENLAHQEAERRLEYLREQEDLALRAQHDQVQAAECARAAETAERLSRVAAAFEVPPLELKALQEKSPTSSRSVTSPESGQSGKRTPTPRLRPYRPRGSSETYYVGESDLDDGTGSVTTMESTHTGSDDAFGPVLPSSSYGSRPDTDSSQDGIYSTKKKNRSPRLGSPGRDTLDPIEENTSLDERRGDQFEDMKAKKDYENVRSYAEDQSLHDQTTLSSQDVHYPRLNKSKEVKFGNEYTAEFERFSFDESGYLEALKNKIAVGKKDPIDEKCQALLDAKAQIENKYRQTPSPKKIDRFSEGYHSSFGENGQHQSITVGYGEEQVQGHVKDIVKASQLQEKTRQLDAELHKMEQNEAVASVGPRNHEDDRSDDTLPQWEDVTCQPRAGFYDRIASWETSVNEYEPEDPVYGSHRQENEFSPMAQDQVSDGSDGEAAQSGTSISGDASLGQNAVSEVLPRYRASPSSSLRPSAVSPSRAARTPTRTTSPLRSTPGSPPRSRSPYVSPSRSVKSRSLSPQQSSNGGYIPTSLKLTPESDVSPTMGIRSEELHRHLATALGPNYQSLMATEKSSDIQHHIARAFGLDKPVSPSPDRQREQSIRSRLNDASISQNDSSAFKDYSSSLSPGTTCQYRNVNEMWERFQQSHRSRQGASDSEGSVNPAVNFDQLYTLLRQPIKHIIEDLNREKRQQKENTQSRRAKLRHSYPEYDQDHRDKVVRDSKPMEISSLDDTAASYTSPFPQKDLRHETSPSHHRQHRREEKPMWDSAHTVETKSHKKSKERKRAKSPDKSKKSSSPEHHLTKEKTSDMVPDRRRDLKESKDRSPKRKSKSPEQPLKEAVQDGKKKPKMSSPLQRVQRTDPALDRSSTSGDTSSSNSSTTSSRYVLSCEETLQSIPEDTTLESVSSEGEGMRKRHLPSDPKLLKLQKKIAQQRAKHQKERKRQLRRKEKIIELEKELKMSGRIQSHSRHTGQESASLSTNDSTTPFTSYDATTDASDSGTLTPSESNTVIDSATYTADSNSSLDVSQAESTNDESTPRYSVAAKTCSDCHGQLICRGCKESRTRSPSPKHHRKPSESPHRNLKGTHHDRETPSKYITKPKAVYMEFDAPPKSKSSPQKRTLPKTHTHSKSARHKPVDVTKAPKLQKVPDSSENTGAYELKSAIRREREWLRNKKHSSNDLETPVKRTVAVNVPTPMTVSPPRRRHHHKVTMVSEAVQTSPQVESKSQRDSHSSSKVKRRSKAPGMFSPELDTSENTNPSDDQHFSSQKKEKPKAPVGWFIPLEETRPWRKPLSERQQYAAGRDTWPHIVPRPGSPMERGTYGYDGVVDRLLEPQIYLTKPALSQSENQGSLQKAFERFNQDFVSRCQERQKLIRLRAEERHIQEIHEQERMTLFAGEKRQEANRHAHPLSDQLFRPKKRFFTKVEMKELTKKHYHKLPEVLRREAEEKRLSEYSKYRLRAALYKKKVQNKVLKRNGPWVH